MYIKVNLSGRNIREAQVGDCDECVLAKKYNTLLQKNYRIKVGSITATIYNLNDTSDNFVLPLSKRNVNIVQKFDDGKLKPCSTYLNIPKRFLKPSVANS